jgi:superfamily II DNA or RNA helicase
MTTRPDFAKTAPKTTAKKSTKPKAPPLSRLRKPDALPVPEWQIGLRRQFGREQNFGLENLGAEPVFSDFKISNPTTQTHYQVAIRGTALGRNFCSCPDYTTNHLGTCKHIEFTLAQLQAKRTTAAILKAGFAPEFSQIWLDYRGDRRVRFSPGAAFPAKLRAPVHALFGEHTQVQDTSEAFQDQTAAVVQLMQAAQQLGHALRCNDDVWAFFAHQRDAVQRRQTLEKKYPKGIQDPALKKLLKVPLYPYQIEGALFATQAGRALIGDDMGLGKTIQAIAAAELLARHFGVQRVLVVCPTSLKHQWKSELDRFTDRPAQVIHGMPSARCAQYQESSFCKITNYEAMARDVDLIQAWAPDLVIADEAQRIKNWNTIAARALKRIQSPYAVVLTGTPLENRLEELISIIQFVDQHCLGPTWRLLDDHQTRDEAGRVIGYRALDQIQTSLAPVMLRRRKSQVLTQLPPRVDNRIFVPLTPEQRKHHDEHGQIVTRIVSRWRKTGYLSDVDQRRLQCSLQSMRMVCNSTYLVDRNTDHGHKITELMELLDELLCDPTAKVVIFSQWLGTHELIVRQLEARPERDWGHVLFNGSVPGDQRGALVERFHQDPACRLFLSTDAGGVGLNLQHAAATVINMDQPWNPAVLEQRIGRVHRMGQSRGVQVINLVGQGCIEEGMLSILAFKKSLFAGVLDGGDSEVFMQGTRLSKFMENVDQATSNIASAEDDSVSPAPSDGPVAENTDKQNPTPDDDLWAPWKALGSTLLQSLAQANSPLKSAFNPSAPPFTVERDATTGDSHIRVKLPKPEALQKMGQQLLETLSTWSKRAGP